jgi:hypothetical protein
MTTQELITYYQNLLIIQYYTKPRARATIAELVEQVLADQIIQKVADAYDIDTAVGVQLDVLAEYRGLSRSYPGVIVEKSDWSLVSYTDPDPDSYLGWAEYADSDPTWYWRTYADEVPPTYKLTDEELRQLIKYKADVDASDYSMKSIDLILKKYFDDYVLLTDNRDMTIKYTHNPSDPGHLFYIVNSIGALPKPAGVRVIVA